MNNTRTRLKLGLLMASIATTFCSHAQAPDGQRAIIKQIDHIMIPAPNADLYHFFVDTLKLPVVYAYRPEAPGFKSGLVSAGNVHLEVIPMPDRQGAKFSGVRTHDRRIVLTRDEKGYVAFDDRCTHRGGSLAGGAMICGTVQCPWHGSQFDVRSGSVKAGPAKENISIHRVEQEGDAVRLKRS